ncbi:MAG: CarD family transcriptional regulator [Rickettsiales bacterium]|nr:CarD family transcriptional regulator [Rickettsiales bacterium]
MEKNLKKNSDDLNLEVGDLVVYPTYGVGEIEEFDTHHIDGNDHNFVLINFKQDKMKLRIPMDKTADSGLRKLSNKKRLSKALDVLGKIPNLKKDMWIKRAKEYEKNINSGDPVLIAEVVRDLHKKDDLLEQQSYSERQIYLTALNRLSNEYAAVESIDKKLSKKKIEELLNA